MKKGAHMLSGMGGFDPATDFDFLCSLNEHLKDFDKQIFAGDLEEKHPNIFILGAPRSGTTLLSQVLFNNLDVATTNNLMARFWNAPLTGAYLSRVILKDLKPEVYESEYATSPNVASPHEFSYFWRNHLLLDNPYTYNARNAVSRIDWSRLKQTLLGFNHIAQKPFVFKTLEYTGYHLGSFASMLEKSYFVYIVRNPLDVARSVYKARLKFNNGDASVWWASVPHEYEKIKDLPFHEQIAGQIFYLTQMYEKGIAQIDPSRYFVIDYSDLCQNPSGFLHACSHRIKAFTGYEVGIVNTPSPFRNDARPLEDEIDSLLSQGLKKFGLI